MIIKSLNQQIISLRCFEGSKGCIKGRKRRISTRYSTSKLLALWWGGSPGNAAVEDSYKAKTERASSIKASQTNRHAQGEGRGTTIPNGLLVLSLIRVLSKIFRKLLLALFLPGTSAP